MIHDENWIRRQIINMWFEYTQEEIAAKLGISLGKVNSIIQEYIKNNEWASKVRDIVISAKKNGVDINQIISNDRFVNAVKRFGSDNDKLELLLGGLGQIITQNDGDPTIAARILYQILEIAYKQHKSPREMLEELQSFTEQCHILKDQIQAIQSALKDNNVTIDEIQICKEFMNNLGNHRFSDMAKTNNVLNNIREQGGDPQKVLDFLSDYSSVKQVLEGLRNRVFDEIRVLEDLVDNSYIRREAIDIWTRIAKRGYSERGIADILEVIEDVVLEYGDGPNGGNSFVAQLLDDLSVYGSLSAANIRLQHQNRDLNFKILMSTKRLAHDR